MLLQQSSEWKEARRHHIGASDAATILGVSPFKTAYRLWQEKVGLVEEEEPTYWMLRGITLEESARQFFIVETGIVVQPAVLFGLEHSFMMASLDGMSEDGKEIVEIKCPGKKTHQLAESGIIPVHYMPQLYHQMVVAEVDHAHYYSFDGRAGVHLIAYRDEEQIKNLIEKEIAFWDCVQNFREPI